MCRMAFLLPAVLVSVLAGSGVCRAQDVANPWSRLSGGVHPLVFVELMSGDELKGRLLRVDAEALVLQVNDQDLRVEASRVARVSKPGDSVKNGAIIGGVVGLVMGGLAAGMADCIDCGDGDRAGVALVSVGLYALVGAGIDALHQGRTTIYDARRAPRVALTFLPASSRGGAAAAMYVGWRW